MQKQPNSKVFQTYFLDLRLTNRLIVCHVYYKKDKFVSAILTLHPFFRVKISGNRFDLK